MASPNLKRPLSSRLRQRGSHKIRDLDRGQIVFVFSVERMVTLELAFSATLDAVPRPLFRARYHSVSKLADDAKLMSKKLCYEPEKGKSPPNNIHNCVQDGLDVSEPLLT